jgi:hypothetical protein
MTVNDLIEELQNLANEGCGEYTMVYEGETDDFDVDGTLCVSPSGRVKLITFI